MILLTILAQLSSTLEKALSSVPETSERWEQVVCLLPDFRLTLLNRLAPYKLVKSQIIAYVFTSLSSLHQKGITFLSLESKTSPVQSGSDNATPLSK